MLLFSPPITPSYKSSPNFLIAQVLGAILLCPSDVIERWVPMMAPFPSTWEEVQHRKTVNKILEVCWNNPDAGYEIQPTDELIVNNSQEQEQMKQRGATGSFFRCEQDDASEVAVDDNIAPMVEPATYGEITPLGARQLFGAMGLHGASSRNYPPAHFFDLGSGTGKLVGQAILELPADTIESATGIELSPSRHECAMRAKEALLQCRAKHYDHDRFMTYDYCNDIVNKLEFLQADLFEVDISSATHIYIASLCFPDTLLFRLERKLIQILSRQAKQQQDKDDVIGAHVGVQNNPSRLEWVATLRRFPSDLGGIRPTIRFMEMSWTKPMGCIVYLYQCSDGS